MKHYGDITKINGASVEAVDIICGGSPCQDLSIAGKRAGLAGERSGLFMDQIRIIKEMRRNDELHCGRTNDDVRPRFMVWENVAGAFTSNDGDDFRIVLEETARVKEAGLSIPGPEGGRWSNAGCIMGDGFSIAWRLHDAQFWGVPQRRKRIALVADFGGSTAPEILFECESVSRDSDQGKSVGQGDPADAKSCVGAAGRCLNSLDASHATAYRKTAHPMRSDQGQGWEETSTNDTLNCHDNGECRTPTIVLENHPADSRIRICADGVFQTLSSRMGTGGNNVPLVMGEPSQTRRTYQKITGTLSPGAHAGSYNGQDAYNDMLIVDANSVAYGLDRASYNQGKNAKYGFSIDKEKIGAQTAMGPGAVCAAYDARGNGDGKTAGTLTGDHENRVTDYTTICASSAVVRRLTPLECERLQGFPDEWTNIGDWIDSKGKLHKGESDSPRYKALGNSIALPFWQWLACRIAAHLPQGASMASLFDGIGGFPLVFSRAGVRPVWASEIEEFPIAVTKKHFAE